MNKKNNLQYLNKRNAKIILNISIVVKCINTQVKRRALNLLLQQKTKKKLHENDRVLAFFEIYIHHNFVDFSIKIFQTKDKNAIKS